MEDQIRRTNNWIYKNKKSNLDSPSGPMAQWIEVLSLYQKIAVSIPTQASQRVTWSKHGEKNNKNYQDEDKSLQ